MDKTGNSTGTVRAMALLATTTNFTLHFQLGSMRAQRKLEWPYARPLRPRLSPRVLYNLRARVNRSVALTTTSTLAVKYIIYKNVMS